jgi:recombination protein RecT
MQMTTPTKSGNEALKQQTGIATLPVAGKPTLASTFEAMKPEFAKVLPRSITPERLVRVALTEIRKNPKLAQCDPQTVVGALMIGAQLGLEPGVMGQAYLVPYNESYKDGSQWKKRLVCQFIPGWQGYVDLVSRTGRAIIETRPVYEGEQFSVDYGRSNPIHHIPNIDLDPEKAVLRAVYAKGWISGAPRPVVEVWGKARVIAHRNRYNKVGDAHYSYANAHNFEMYARKIVLLQVIKYLPKSVELQTAAGLEYAAESGNGSLTIAGASEAMDGLLSLPEAPREATPYDEKFDLLAWNEQERGDFLVAMKDATEAEINAALDAELNETTE